MAYPIYVNKQLFWLRFTEIYGPLYFALIFEQAVANLSLSGVQEKPEKALATPLFLG